MKARKRILTSNKYKWIRIENQKAFPISFLFIQFSKSAFRLYSISLQYFR